MSAKAVVIDNGSGSLKVGYQGANFPSAVVQQVVGRPVLRAKKKTANTIGAAKKQDDSEGPALKDIMVGEECTGVRHLLDLTFPVKENIADADDMMKVWDFAFSKMELKSPSDHPATLCETPTLNPNTREKLYEILFEKYGFDRVQSVPQGLLTLYSVGITTGIAVDCGESITHCTPVYDGLGFPNANKRVDVGGRHVTNRLVRLMQQRGYHFSTAGDQETMRVVKEMFCYAAVDVQKERKLARETCCIEKSMLLPDGSPCTIGPERFEATECLFRPGLAGLDADGIGAQVFKSINAVDINLRKSLYENVILSGGSTMFPGLPSRLEADMTDLFVAKQGGDRSKARNMTKMLKINDAPRRRNNVFLGGAVYSELTNSPDFEHMWLTKKQYAEEGKKGIKRIASQYVGQ